MAKTNETTTRPLSKGALEEAQAQASPKTYEYSRGNFEELLIIQNNQILAQLKEMNYYMHKLAGEPEYEVE